MNTVSLGSEGEGLAVEFLKKKNYKIIAKNYKTFIGEIDIIAKDGDTIVFVEVKTRANDAFGLPFEAVNKGKRQKLKNLALLFLKKHPREAPARFDVISIVQTHDGNKVIEHITDAFEV
jgi:putative endonuclease